MVFVFFVDLAQVVGLATLVYHFLAVVTEVLYHWVSLDYYVGGLRSDWVERLEKDWVWVWV